MKHLKHFATLIVLLLSVMFGNTIAKNQIVFYDLIPSNDYTSDNYGWIQGVVIASPTELSSEEARAYCLGKQPTSKMQAYKKLGKVEIDGVKFPYVYIMLRDPETTEPNLRFEIKEVKLESQSYKLSLADEPGEG